MRILHIVLSLKVGGLEKFVIDLCDNYPNGCVYKIACLEETGELSEKRRDLQCVSLGKRDGIDLSVIKKIARIVRKDRIQLIHTHNQGPNFYGALAGFLCGVPVVHTKHGQNNCENRKHVLLDRLSSIFTRKIVCVSRDAALICKDIIKIPPDKIEVILNGIDTYKFAFKKKPRSIFHDCDFVIGNVARLSPEKDQHTLLKAVRLLKDSGLKFKVAIVGDGRLRSELEQFSRSNGLNSEVHFFGMRHDVERIVPEFDVFVLPSLTEGIPLTLLEAMSCGIPIIATSIGGIPEVVAESITGFLVPIKDPGAIANKIRVMHQHPKLRQIMGMSARQRIIDYFNIKKTARQYYNLYSEVLGL